MDKRIIRFQLRLKEKRLEIGLTQKGLSRRTGIDHGYICKLEQGSKVNPSLRTMLRFCRAFNCTLSELVGE